MGIARTTSLFAFAVGLSSVACGVLLAAREDPPAPGPDASLAVTADAGDAAATDSPASEAAATDGPSGVAIHGLPFTCKSGVTCRTPTPECCLTSLDRTCTTLALCATQAGVVLTCERAQECAAGQICCVISNTVGPRTSECRQEQDCTGLGSAILCDMNDPGCTNGARCDATPVTSGLPGLYSCQ